MISRPANTILLVTRDEIARADVRGGVLTVSRSARPVIDDFPSLVEAAIRLGGRRPGRVWVLSTEFWNQTLSLSPEATAGVKADQLGRALGFEAESFSGLSAMEATVAYVPLPGSKDERPFWLIQVPHSLVEQVEYVVGQAGGRLVGLCHPAGLPRPLRAGAGVWQRVELWPGEILCVRGMPGREPVVHVRNTDPRPGRWEADVASWLADGPADAATEILCSSGDLAQAEATFKNRILMDDEDSLRGFLGAWAESLAGGVPAVPAVCPPKRPMSAGTRRMVALVVGLVIAILCLGHHMALEHQNKTLAAETKRLKEPADRLAQLTQRADDLKKRQSELKAKCEKLEGDLEACRRMTLVQRQRLASLLTVLAEQGRDQFVIQKIEATEDEIVLHGVSLDHRLADSLAGILEQTVSPLGWQVQLADKRSKELLMVGGPWEFDVRIRDTGTPPPAPAPATTSTGQTKK
jgi:hypothetical protein